MMLPSMYPRPGRPGRWSQMRHRPHMPTHRKLDRGLPLPQFPVGWGRVEPGCEQLIGLVAATGKDGADIPAEHRGSSLPCRGGAAHRLSVMLSESAL
jgi:hypothetical protein